MEPVDVNVRRPVRVESSLETHLDTTTLSIGIKERMVRKGRRDGASIFDAIG